MNVRAKFRVTNKDEQAKTVRLEPVVGGSPENDEFFSATPSGLIQLNIVKAAAFSQFEPGKACYVDFTFPETENPAVAG